MKNIVSLKQNSDFRRLYKKKSCARPTLVLYARHNSANGSGRRIGITVSRKIGKANVRNRAKRRLREVFLANQSRLAEGTDIVIVARFKTAQAPFELLVKDFLKAAEELGILKNTDKTV